MSFTIIITACSMPMELLPKDIRKRSAVKNGTYIIKGESDVFVNAPCLECLQRFDTDIHGYMNITEPYFPTVKGNDKNSVKKATESMCTRGFYIAETFEDRFTECRDFVNKM